jgi:hypothetical protein
MRWVWCALIVVVLAGIVALVWPQSAIGSTSALPAPTLASGPAAARTPAPTVVASVPTASTPNSVTPVTTAKPTGSTPASTPIAPAPKPTKPAAREAILKEVPAGGLTLGLDVSIPHATVTPGTIMRQPDGALMADGKYRIEGDGSRERPYRIAWDLLASANKTYIPRLKENLLPQRVALLEGAWVRIDGYFALPLMLQESSEILVMLNQWDGCCIGLPPTPYDAMEVRLVEPVKPSRRHAFNFGTVQGRLKVDPMLVENWLVGLYRLEEATLTQGGL